jgi:hypothetical protein
MTPPPGGGERPAASPLGKQAAQRPSSGVLLAPLPGERKWADAASGFADKTFAHHDF